MGRRARLIGRLDLAVDCDRVSAPTLVVTGERSLDHVVSVDHSNGYVSLIRGARGAVLERTGHLGSITRPEQFAAIVRDFADRRAREVA
jgi:pimeloyl-ACP methyl ester carboxylesterase